MRMRDEQEVTVGLKDTSAWFHTLWPSFIKATQTPLQIQVQKTFWARLDLTFMTCEHPDVFPGVDAREGVDFD